MKKSNLLALSLAFGLLCIPFASCGGGKNPSSTPEPTEHTHTYETEWTYDETHHWHKATCEHTSEVDGKALHDLKDRKCTVCDYEEEAPHVAQRWEANETSHWKICSDCGEKFDEETHDKGAVCSVCGFVYEYTAGLALEFNEETDSYTVAGIGTASGDTIIIPAYHEQKPVTKIGRKAFYATSDEPDTTLKNVVIPHTVEEIEANAFTHCQALAEIDFGGSQVIGEYAFWDTAVVNVELSNIINLGKYSFYACQSLKSVVLPDSLETIGKGAFYTCKALKSVVIGSGVNSVDEYAFYGCTNLTDVTLKEGIYIIGYGMFRGCSSLAEIVIPDSVTEIQGSAFYECTALSSITIGSGVSTIGKYAFEGMGLGEKNIYYSGDLRGWCEIDDQDGYLMNKNRTLYIGGKKVEGDIVIPEGTTKIMNYAFYRQAITSVTIPDSVETMGIWVFGYCDLLESVQIGSGLAEINTNAFSACSVLTSVTLSEGLQVIANGAFQNCTSLKSIIIPASVVEIGWTAFYGDKQLESAVFLDPTGWHGASASTLADPASAAECLKSYTDLYKD